MRYQIHWSGGGRTGDVSPMRFGLFSILIGFGGVALGLWLSAADKVNTHELGDWGPTLIPLGACLLGLTAIVGGLHVVFAERAPALARAFLIVRIALQIAYVPLFAVLAWSVLRGT